MEDAHQEITDKLDKELNRYIAQYAALFMLNEEIDVLLQSESLKEQTMDCQTVSTWLSRLQEMVQDAMQQPHGTPAGDVNEPSPEEFRLAAGTT